MVRYFRFVLAVIAFYGMVVVNLTRTDFNITIINMTRSDCNDSRPKFHGQKVNANVSDYHDGSDVYFCWDTKIEELLVCAYFIGYLFQLPGGYFAQKIGAYYIVATSMAMTILLCFVTPEAAMQSWQLLMIVRILQGLGAAVTFPGMTAMWSKWAPTNEKATLFSITNSGHFVGAALADALSGLICQNMVWGGWQGVFRIFGIIGIVWLVLWCVFTSSKPETNWWLSMEELTYIENNRAPPRPNHKIPWKWVLTSPCVIGIYVAHISNYYGYLIVLVCMPQYLKDVHNLDMSNLGLFTALPVLAMFVMSIMSGRVTDLLISSGKVSTTVARKVNTLIGLVIPGVVSITIAYASSLSTTIVIILMVILQGTNGFVFAGYHVNYIDVSPENAGVTSGIGNSIATISGIAGPLILYYFQEMDGDKTGEWRKLFSSVGGVMITGAVIYCFLGKGERQVTQESDKYEELDGSNGAETK